MIRRVHILKQKRSKQLPEETKKKKRKQLEELQQKYTERSESRQTGIYRETI